MSHLLTIPLVSLQSHHFQTCELQTMGKIALCNIKSNDLLIYKFNVQSNTSHNIH